MVTVTNTGPPARQAEAPAVASQDATAGALSGRGCYFTKYQSSGLMVRVGLSGVAPLRLVAISLSW